MNAKKIFRHTAVQYCIFLSFNLVFLILLLFASRLCHIHRYLYKLADIGMSYAVIAFYDYFIGNLFIILLAGLIIILLFEFFYKKKNKKSLRAKVMIIESQLVLLCTIIYLSSSLMLFHESLVAPRVSIALIKLEKEHDNAEICYATVEELVSLLKSTIKDEQNGKTISSVQLERFSRDFDLFANYPQIEEQTGVKRDWFVEMSNVTDVMSKEKRNYFRNKVINNENGCKESIKLYRALLNKCIELFGNPQFIKKKKIPNK